MGINVIFNSFSYEILPRLKETFDKYCKIIQWGRLNPTRFLEQFLNLSFTDHQKYVLLSSWVPANVVWVCSRSSGKAVSLYTHCVTRDPKTNKVVDKTIGNLKLGDEILGADGKFTKIIQLHPIIFEKPYQITFSDGDTIECNGEHLWDVYNPDNKNELIVLEAQLLYKDYKIVDKEGNITYKYSIPTMFGSNNGLSKEIVKIEISKDIKPMRCITVDNDSGSFVCGNNYTVTHNSFMSAPFIMARSLLIPSHKTYIMGPSGGQAQETFTKMENLAKNNIASVIGVSSVFLDETVRANSKADPFTHDKQSYHVGLYNGSEVFSLNSVAKNIVGIRANMDNVQMF